MAITKVRGQLLTGVDDNATSTAITIDSSENVIVGRTSLSASGLGVATGKNITFSEGSSASYANMYRQNNSGGLMLANGYQYGDGTNGNHSSVGSSFAKTLIGLRNGGIYFYADAAATASIGTQVTPTEIARITTNGLTFNGDTAAANALDDYEEGTWTPALGGVNSISYANRLGHYTKVGNLVHADFYLRVSGAGSGTTIFVSGLPYVIKNVNSIRGGGCSTYQSIGSNTVQFYGSQGGTLFYCYINGGTDFTTTSTLSNHYLIGTFTYIAA